MHGLTGDSTEKLEKFNKKDGHIVDDFKIICAPVEFITG